MVKKLDNEDFTLPDTESNMDNTAPESIDVVKNNPLNNENNESEIWLKLDQDVSGDPNDLVIKNIIKGHIIIAASASLIPVPFFDFAALTASQISLLKSLCEHYAIPFDETNSKTLLINLLGGALPVLSIAGLSSLSKLIPIVGSLVGSASLSIIAGATTYAVGRVFNQHFLQGGTLDDFSPTEAKILFKREFKKAKKLKK